MENRGLDKAMDIYTKLITGEEISGSVNADLYEEYAGNAQVYDILHTMLKKSNLKIYEYKQALYVTAGEQNRVFGYTNDELKKTIGLRVNKELFLAYFIIFETLLLFYKSSSDFSSREYVKAEEVIEAVTLGLKRSEKDSLKELMSDTEKDSFKTLAVLWDELPLTAVNEDNASLKAARGSKTGMVKLVFNFLQEQKLFFETGGKYYALDRFRAMAENYYDEAKSRLYEIISQGGEEDAAY